MLVFLKGALLGVLIAAPVGPMSLLCMRRALEQGWVAGAFSGLGIALADGVYAACAAFGLAAVANAIAEIRTPLHLIGGAALCVLGVQMLRGGAKDGAASRLERVSPLTAFATTFALTIVNPATIIAFAGLYAGAISLGTGFHPQIAAVLVIGTFFGSLVWWLTISGVVAATRHLLSPAAVRAVRVGSSLGLVTFGIVILATR
ncbi:MAG TPA: LysE family transporter [Candidatus Dormibacteraeota bacterium]|nr:LysE family transporter [Candidatus Dormibacteraeota bacterium]